MFINKRFSFITQLKVKAFSIIITALLLSNIEVMAGENQLSGDSRLNCVKEEEGAPITAIASYDNGRSAICGDMEGNIYRVNADSSKKLTSSTLGSIDSIVYGNAFTGDFCFVAGGRIYEYKDEQIIDISGKLTEKIKKLYKDESNNEIYGITKDNNVYYLSENNGLNWVTAEPQTAEKILKNTISDNDNSNSINKNSEWMAVQNISSYVDSHGKKFAGTNNGQIYATNPYDPQPMTVKANYVSDAVGTDTSKAIYRVTIDGHRLNADDIFTTGYNGFKYILSSDNNPLYNSDAYPVNGLTYESDGEDNASLQNREISFLWLGPKCTVAGVHKLTVKELAYNFSTDTKDQLIDTVTIDLPAATQLPDYKVTVKNIQIIENDSLHHDPLYRNGTCGFPFNVIITDKDGKVIEDVGADNVYDHLVFYIQDDNKTPKENGLIGCDPFYLESKTAILPRSCTEIPGGNYIKYGTVGYNCKKYLGRTFYAYITGEGDRTIYAGLLIWDGTKYVFGKYAIQSLTSAVDSVSVGYTSDYLNDPRGRNFSFGSGVNGSNWQGNKWGFGGYLDYQLTDYKNGYYKGIFVYLPEGLNKRDFNDRKDLRKDQLKIGYYFDPQVSPASPLMAVNYHINDTPSFCDKMRFNTLHAMFFDQYGRCSTEYSLYDSENPVKDIVDIDAKQLWDTYTKGDLTQDMHMVIKIGNIFKTPIIIGADGKSKNYGVTSRGLFVPPINSGVNATFMTEVPSKIGDTIYGDYKVTGYKIAADPDFNGCALFSNELKIHDEKITLTVAGSDLVPGDAGKDSHSFKSLNNICIKDYWGWHPLNLDSWSVFHVPADIKDKYTYWYGIRRYGAVAARASSDAYGLGPDWKSSFYGTYMEAIPKYYMFDKDIEQVNTDRYSYPQPAKPSTDEPLTRE